MMLTSWARISSGKVLSRCVAIAVISSAALAQNELIILQNADSLVGKTINGESLRELNGHVRLVQGNVRVWCDRAIQHLARNEVELIGNVKVVRDTVTLTARRGRYFGNEKRAECQEGVRLQTKHVLLLADFGTYYTDERKAFFYSNVRVIDSTTTIYCDRLTYYENERRSVAVNNVRVKNAGNNVQLFGNHLEHYDETGYSKMTLEPRMMQIDTTSTGEIDTLVVKSIVMESFEDSVRRVIATDSVAFVRGRLAARSGWVKYRTEQQLIDLFRQPIIWYDDNQVSGDSISLFLRNNRLQSASIRSRAFALSLSDSAFPNRYNQLTGKSIFMQFDNDQLRQMTVENNAVCLYYLYDEREGNGLNKTSGDRVTMSFAYGRLDYIRVIKGVEGIYYPEKMIAGKEFEFNLDGFLLRKDRPIFESVFPKIENL